MKHTPIVAGTIVACLFTCHAAAAPNTLWSTVTADSYPPSIAAAPSGGVYVTSTTSGGSAATLTCYSNSGVRVWGTTIDRSSGYDVEPDAQGNVFLTGETYTNLDSTWLGGGDTFLRKYSSSGALLWGRQFGTPQYDVPVGVDVDANGSVYVTSSPWPANYGTAPAGTVTTVRKFLSNGTAGWVANLDPGNGSYPNINIGVHGTVIDSQGDLFAGFSTYTNINNTIALSNYISKINAAGQVQWIHPFARTVLGLAADSNEDILLASGSLSKYDANGDLVWTSSDGTSKLYADFIATDGTIYAAGVRSNAGYAAAYSSTGSLLWSSTFPPPSGYTKLSFYDLTVSDNQLVLAGQLVTSGSWSGNYIVCPGGSRTADSAPSHASRAVLSVESLPCLPTTDSAGMKREASLIFTI